MRFGSGRAADMMPPSLTPIRILAGLAAIGIAALIIYLSLIPAREVPGPPVSDKLKHFMAYAALAVPMTLAAGAARWRSVVIVAALFGIGLEFAQAAVTADREGSGLDALANLMGALFGAGLVWIGLRLRR